jgi:hypothetical protein
MTAPALPQLVVTAMTTQEHRMGHTSRHFIRQNWLSESPLRIRNPADDTITTLPTGQFAQQMIQNQHSRLDSTSPCVK